MKALLITEIIRGEDYSFSVDWWILRVLIFEMMVGEPPFHIAENSDIPDQHSITYLLQLIVERKVHIPHGLSVDHKCPAEFSGQGPKGTTQLASSDRVYHGHSGPSILSDDDWDMMEQKHLVHPFKPNLSKKSVWATLTFSLLMDLSSSFQMTRTL